MPTPKIGLIAHVGKPGAAELIKSVLEQFALHGCSPILESRTAGAVGHRSSFSTADLGQTCDLLVALGGDGTLLQILRDLGDRPLKPVFGINLGSLGFLTCAASTAYVQAVRAIMTQEFILSDRALLEVEVERENRIIAKGRGLNDAVLSRGEVSRLIKMRTKVDGAALTEFNADGLIIATPTGSSAYSLSAGGPILTPDSGVFVITPICPHVLTNRSVIVSDSAVVEVCPSGAYKDIILSVDGQEMIRVHQGDIIRIQRSRMSLPLAMLPEMSFFEVLRQKLKWSGSAIE